MSKRKTDLEKLFEGLYELTKMFWMIGAVISGLLTYAGFMALNWVIKLNTDANSNYLIEAVNNSWMGYAIYLLPIIFFLIALIFAWRSFETFITQY